MSLIDDLAEVGRQLPPSHKPVLADVIDVVGGMIAHTEHGDSVIEAAKEGADELLKVISPPPPEPPPPAAGEPAPGQVDPAAYADLLQRVEALQAQVGQQRATPPTGGPLDPPADPAPPA